MPETPPEVDIHVEPRRAAHTEMERRRAEQRVERDGEGRSPAQVRGEDLEPHAGLRYIAKLFKVLAILLLLLLVAEIVLGFADGGAAAIPTLLVEATRLIVFAGFLWGAADLALMLIESNHDLRATRILVGRLNGKLQRLTEIEADELEILAANPGARSRESS